MSVKREKSASEIILGAPIKGEFMLVGLNHRVQLIPQSAHECAMEDLEHYGFGRGPSLDIRGEI